MLKSLYTFICMTGLLLVAAAGQGAQAQELPDAPGPVTIADNSVAAPLSGHDADPLAAHSLAITAQRASRVPTHRFFDRTNLMLTGTETAALLADGITTQNRLGQIRTQYRTVNGVVTPVQVRVTEVDPIGKLFVNHGWPGTIAGGALTIGSDLGVRYLLHRTNHHRLERLVPLMLAASNTFAAIHNTRY